MWASAVRFPATSVFRIICKKLAWWVWEVSISRTCGRVNQNSIHLALSSAVSGYTKIRFEVESRRNALMTAWGIPTGSALFNNLSHHCNEAA